MGNPISLLTEHFLSMLRCVESRILWKKVAGADAESFGELGKIHDAYVAFATFDATDVVAVQAGLKTQILLRPAPFFPK
jgi:hypothetical protein